MLFYVSPHTTCAARFVPQDEPPTGEGVVVNSRKEQGVTTTHLWDGGSSWIID